MKKLLLAYVFALLTVFAANAQDGSNYINEPGYVNFGDLTSFEKGDDVTEVFVEQNLLKMVSKMTKQKDPDLSNLLAGIKLVKVNSFNVKDNLQKDLKTKLDGIDKQLTNKNWTRLVKVRGSKEYTNVYMKPTADGNSFDGLVVTTIESGGQVSLVNIVGKIDLETIGKLSDQFDIPALNKAKNK